MVVLWRWWVEIVGEGCWRVAEVSLTLDGVPVRIVILWDVQRRGAQLSWPLCRPSDATDRRGTRTTRNARRRVLHKGRRRARLCRRFQSHRFEHARDMS